MQVFDLRCLKLGGVYLAFPKISRFIHLTQMVVIYWFLLHE